MRGTDEFESSLGSARELQKAGRFLEAEQKLQPLLKVAGRREMVLQALFDLYMQSGQPQHAVEVLDGLIDEVPDSLTYHAHLANLMQTLGIPEAAIIRYERLLERRPELSDAHFSIAVLYKQAKRYSDAIRAYEKALELGIDRAEEVYSNLGVLYSDILDVPNSMLMYQRALQENEEYVPAQFNLAGLYEETGDRDRAIEIYERILNVDPHRWDSLARLAQATKVTDSNDPIFDRLSNGIDVAKDDRIDRESLYFALGKLHDEVGQYDQAFAAYSAGNVLGKERNPPYYEQATENAFGELISIFDREWIERNKTDSSASPIFICGMFRSGSTLVEQMLGAHPAIASGGELEVLPWLLPRRLGPYPRRLRSVTPQELEEVGNEYLSMTRAILTDAANISDKRPDNFLHLGLIKAMFPRARIIYTQRNRLDNCLSIFFQQLGGNLSYATELNDIAHYLDQHQRLKEHWTSCLGEDMFIVDYEQLVSSPEPVLRGLVKFLGLEWDEQCLNFSRTGGAVKTASIWQVRDGLYTSSSGRWANYETVIPDIQSL